MACTATITLDGEVFNFSSSGNGLLSLQAEEIGNKMNDFLTQKLREQNESLDDVNLDEEETDEVPEEPKPQKSKKPKKQKR